MIDFGALGILINSHGSIEQRARCPRCSTRERDDTLGVNIDTGAFHCFRCGWKGRVGGSTTRPPIVQRLDDPALAERKRERLRAIWRDSVPLSDARAHAVRQYLASRALTDILLKPPAVLRAHPGLTYYEHGGDIGTYPAMLALFTDEKGDGVTLHATYLRSDGGAKAPIHTPKKLLQVPVRGATKGGAIRLHRPVEGVLGIAEGIETALSLHLLHQVPVWAASCADAMQRVRLPPGLRQLLIGVDLDASGKGEAAARALAARVLRWRHRPEVLYVMPEIAAPADLNDELRRRRMG